MQIKDASDLFGLDISSLQSITDEQLLFNSINFLICRAYGTNHSAGGDSKFVDYVTRARNHNCPVGGYYFGTPFIDAAAGVSTDAQIQANAQTQAQEFIDKLQTAFGSGNYGDLIPMLDLEAYKDSYTQYGHTATIKTNYPQMSGMTGAQVLTWVKAFRDYFWSHTGRRLGFYSNRYFLTTTDTHTGPNDSLNTTGDKLGLGWTTAQMNEISNMPLWLAEYDEYNTPNTQPADLAGWPRYVAWQYTGLGSASTYGLSHIDNHVDLNRSKSIDWLKPPPPPVSLSADQTADNTITVYFSTPNIVDYLGANLYINGVWKKWVTSTANQTLSTTFDITGYARNVDLTYQIQIEDTYSDLGKSSVNTLKVFPTFAESELNIMPVASMGTVLKKATTAIAELTSIDGVSVSMDTVETTTLDTVGGYRTFINGLRDAGEVSISGHFVYTGHKAMFDDFETGASASYTIEFPDKITTTGTKWTFTAIVTAFGTSVDLEDLITFEATLKISGKPTLSAPV